MSDNSPEKIDWEFVLHMIGDGYLSDNIGNSSLDALKSFKKIINDDNLKDDILNIIDESIKVENKSSNISIIGNLKYTRKGVDKLFNSYEKQDIILLSGYNNGWGGHAICMYIKYKGDNNYTVVITNSGEGISNYHKIDADGKKYQCVVIKKRVSKEIVKQLYYHKLFFQRNSYLQEPIFFKLNIDNFYKILINIFDDKKVYNELIDRYAIFPDYSNIKYAEYSIESDTKKKLDSYSDDEKYYLQPQISGSCTFYSLYYIFYYIFTKNGKNINDFHYWMSGIRKDKIETIYDSITKYNNDDYKPYKSNNMAIYDVLVNHVNMYEKTFDDNNIKKIYTDKYAILKNMFKKYDPYNVLNNYKGLEISNENNHYQININVDQGNIYEVYNNYYTELQELNKSIGSIVSANINTLVDDYSEMVNKCIILARQFSNNHKAVYLINILIFSIWKFIKSLNNENLISTIGKYDTINLNNFYKKYWCIFYKTYLLMIDNNGLYLQNNGFQFHRNFAILGITVAVKIFLEKGYKDISSSDNDSNFSKYFSGETYIFRYCHIYGNDYKDFIETLEKVKYLIPVENINNIFIANNNWKDVISTFAGGDMHTSSEYTDIQYDNEGSDKLKSQDSSKSIPEEYNGIFTSEEKHWIYYFFYIFHILSRTIVNPNYSYSYIKFIVSKGEIIISQYPNGYFKFIQYTGELPRYTFMDIPEKSPIHNMDNCFFLIWDLFKYDKVDLINNSKLNWSDFVVPSVIMNMLSDKREHINNNTLIAYNKYSDYLSNIKLMKIIPNKEQNGPIKIREKILGDINITKERLIKYRIDFIIWIITTKIIFNVFTGNEKQIFIELLENSESEKYKDICELLILILNKEETDEFVTIYSKLLYKKHEPEPVGKKLYLNPLPFYLLGLYLRDVPITKITQIPSKDIYAKALAKKNIDNVIFLENDSDKHYCVDKIKYNHKEYYLLDRTIFSNQLFFIDENYSIYFPGGDISQKSIEIQKKYNDGTIKKYTIKYDRSSKKYIMYDGNGNKRYNSSTNKEYHKYNVFNTKYIFCWGKNNKIKRIEFYEHNIKLIWKDTHYTFDNKLVLTNSDNTELYYKKWVYNLDNAFLLKDEENMKYSILILKPANDYIKELANNSFWVKSNDKYDVKLIFKKKYYELQIDDYGFSISGSDDAIQAYLSTLCLFGNYEVLEDIIIKGRILGCKLPYFHDKHKKKIAEIINNPFKYYFFKLFYKNTNNDINEKYNKRINWYVDRYKYDSFITWGDKSGQGINLTQKNFLDDILEVDESNDITTCKLIKDYNNEIAGKKKEIESEINSSKKTYSTNYENYNKNRTENQVNYMFKKDIYETIYNIIYNKIQLQCLNFISDNKDNLDCQQLLEYYNRLDKNKIYTGQRYNYEIYFELLFGNIIRQDQKDLIDNIIEDIKGEKGEGKNIFQMLMGKGKTSVISPLLCYYCAHIYKKKQIIMAMPGTLVPQSKNIFANYPLLLKNILLRECKEIRTESDIEDCIQTSPNTNQVLIMKGTVLQSFLLNYVSSEDKTPELENTVIIADEIDTLMDPLSSELNYPYETPKSPKELGYISEIIIDIVFYYINEEKIFTEKRKCEIYVNDLFDNYDYNNKLSDEYKVAWKYAFYRIGNIKDEDARAVYLFRKIKELFVQILQMYYNKDYGIGDIKDSYGELYPPKNGYIAIPYISTDNPANKSEFSDAYLTLIMTVLSYKYRGLTKNNIIKIIKEYYLKHLDDMYKEKYIDDIVGDKGKTNIIIKYPYRIEEIISNDIVNKKKYSKELIILFLRQFVIKRFIKESTEQLNSSFTDVTISNFCKYRTGFSGTTNIHLPKFIDPDNSPSGKIDYDNCEDEKDIYKEVKWKKINEYTDICKDDKAEAQIKFAFEHKIIKGKIMNDGIINKYKVSVNEDYNVLDDILERIPDYDSLIDVGALLRNYKSKEVAEKLYPVINKSIVYLNEDSEKYIYDGSNFQKYKDDGSNNDIFIYYDQKHTVGIDIKQKPKIAGLVTISNFNKLTDASQGVYRLRKINRGHYVDFFIGESAKQITTREDLYKYLVKKENYYKDNSEFRALLQNIKTNARYQKENKESFKEEVYNSLNFINKIDNLSQTESEIFFEFVKKSVCNDSNVLQIALCTEMCNKLKNTQIRVLNKVQQKEEDKQEDKQEEEEATKEVNQKNENRYIFDDFDFHAMTYNDYFKNYKNKIKLINNHNFNVMGDGIYFSPYCFYMLIYSVNNYEADLFNYIDCIAIKTKNNDILLVTYTELYILSDKIEDNQIFSKFDNPKSAEEVYAKYVMNGILDHTDLGMLLSYKIGDINKYIDKTSKLYADTIPYSNIFKNSNNISDYVKNDKDDKLIPLLNLENFGKNVINRKLNYFKQFWYKKTEEKILYTAKIAQKIDPSNFSKKIVIAKLELINNIQFLDCKNTKSLSINKSIFSYNDIAEYDYLIFDENSNIYIDVPLIKAVYNKNYIKPYLIKNALWIYDSKNSKVLPEIEYKYINVIVTELDEESLKKALFLIQKDIDVNVHIPNLLVDQAILEDVQKVIDPNIRLILWDKA